MTMDCFLPPLFSVFITCREENPRPKQRPSEFLTGKGFFRSLWRSKFFNFCCICIEIGSFAGFKSPCPFCKFEMNGFFFGSFIFFGGELRMDAFPVCMLKDEEGAIEDGCRLGVVGCDSDCC